MPLTMCVVYLPNVSSQGRKVFNAVCCGHDAGQDGKVPKCCCHNRGRGGGSAEQCQGIQGRAYINKIQQYGRGEVLNPPPPAHIAPGLAKSPPGVAPYFQWLAQEYQEPLQATTGLLQQIAVECGAELHSGPVKGMRRILAKLEKYGPANVRRVTDTRRASVVCDDFLTMAAVLQCMSRSFIIVRLKNRFCEQNKTADDSAGYRDCQMLLLCPNSRLLFEAQLHLRMFYDIKCGLANSTEGSVEGLTGHQRYISFRTAKESNDSRVF